MCLQHPRQGPVAQQIGDPLLSFPLLSSASLAWMPDVPFESFGSLFSQVLMGVSHGQAPSGLKAWRHANKVDWHLLTQGQDLAGGVPCGGWPPWTAQAL